MFSTLGFRHAFHPSGQSLVRYQAHLPPLWGVDEVPARLAPLRTEPHLPPQDTDEVPACLPPLRTEPG